MTKKSFYCWYLGSTEAYGMEGPHHVYEVIHNIIHLPQNHKHKHHLGSSSSNSSTLPANLNNASSTNHSAETKVTLRLNENCIAVIDNSVVSPKRTGLRKTEAPVSAKSFTINYDCITFICRLTDLQLSDVVACIVKNVNTKPNITLTVYAFRCDSQDTSLRLEQFLNYFRTIYMNKLEKMQKKQANDQKCFNMLNAAAGSLNYSDPNLSEMGGPIIRAPSPHKKAPKNFFKRQVLRILSNQSLPKKLTASSNSSHRTRSSSQSQNHDDQSLSFSLHGNASDESINMHHYYFQQQQQQLLQLQQQQQLQQQLSYMKYPVVAAGAPDYYKPNPMDKINKELQSKFQSTQPILFPPKDYDPVDRMRGNLIEADDRRCLNSVIVGGQEALKTREHVSQYKRNSVTDSLGRTSDYENTPLKKENSQNKLFPDNHVPMTRKNSSKLSDHQSSFDEQANQVLNYFDQMVESALVVQPVDTANNIYKYEPPKSPQLTPASAANFLLPSQTSNASSTQSSLLVRQSSINSKPSDKSTPPTPNSFYLMSDPPQSASSTSSTNTKDSSSASNTSNKNIDPFYYELTRNSADENGAVKKNPLHVIDEESANILKKNNSLKQNATDPYFNFRNLIGGPASSNDQSPGPVATPSNGLNSAAAAYGLVGSSNNNNSDPKLDNSPYKPGEPMNPAVAAASTGFRNNVLPKLSVYQPQWITTPPSPESKSPPDNKSYFMKSDQAPLPPQPLATRATQPQQRPLRINDVSPSSGASFQNRKLLVRHSSINQSDHTNSRDAQFQYPGPRAASNLHYSNSAKAVSSSYAPDPNHLTAAYSPQQQYINQVAANREVNKNDESVNAIRHGIRRLLTHSSGDSNDSSYNTENTEFILKPSNNNNYLSDYQNSPHTQSTSSQSSQSPYKQLPYTSNMNPDYDYVSAKSNSSTQLMSQQPPSSPTVIMYPPPQTPVQLKSVNHHHHHPNTLPQSSQYAANNPHSMSQNSSHPRHHHHHHHHNHSHQKNQEANFQQPQEHYGGQIFKSSSRPMAAGAYPRLQRAQTLDDDYIPSGRHSYHYQNSNYPIPSNHTANANNPVVPVQPATSPNGTATLGGGGVVVNHSPNPIATMANDYYQNVRYYNPYYNHTNNHVNSNGGGSGFRSNYNQNNQNLPYRYYHLNDVYY